MTEIIENHYEFYVCTDSCNILFQVDLDLL